MSEECVPFRTTDVHERNTAPATYCARGTSSHASGVLERNTEAARGLHSDWHVYCAIHGSWAREYGVKDEKFVGDRANGSGNEGTEYA